MTTHTNPLKDLVTFAVPHRASPDDKAYYPSFLMARPSSIPQHKTDMDASYRAMNKPLTFDECLDWMQEAVTCELELGFTNVVAAHIHDAEGWTVVIGNSLENALRHLIYSGPWLPLTKGE